jgi:hypothetical protein
VFVAIACRVDRQTVTALPFRTRPHSRRVGSAAGGPATGGGTTAYVGSISTLCATLQQGFVPVLDTSDTLSGIPTPPGSAEAAAAPADTAMLPSPQQLVAQQALKLEEEACVPSALLPPPRLPQQQATAALAEPSAQQLPPLAQPCPVQPQPIMQHEPAAPDIPIHSTAGMQQQDAASQQQPVALVSAAAGVSSCQAVLKKPEGTVLPNDVQQGPGAMCKAASQPQAQQPDSLQLPPLAQQLQDTTADWPGPTQPASQTQLAAEQEVLEEAAPTPPSKDSMPQPRRSRSRSPPSPNGGRGDSSRRSSGTNCALAGAGERSGSQPPAAQPSVPAQPAQNGGGGGGGSSGAQASCLHAQPPAPEAACDRASVERLGVVLQGQPAEPHAADCASALAPAWCTPPPLCRPCWASTDAAAASDLLSSRHLQPPACSSSESAQTQHAQPTSQRRLPMVPLPLQPPASASPLAAPHGSPLASTDW